MSIDEAINILKQYVDYDNPDIPDFYTMEEAIKVIIKALEQDPSYNSIKTELEPCEDAVSRQAVIDAIDKWIKNMYVLAVLPANEVRPLFESVYELPPVTPQPKMGRCKDCKYFEYDSVAKVNGIPLIVAHEICKRWSDGCKSKEDGYCFLFEPQESEDNE